MAGLVRLRCRQVEKRRPEVHRRWLLPVQFPYAGAARLAARPETADAYEFAFVFQRSPARQITPPVSLHLWHSFGKAAYRGNDRPKPSQFIGRQSPRRRAKWQRLSMTEPIAAVHLGRWLRAPVDSL